MRGKRRPSDGRTQAHPALSSVGIPQRVCLPPPPCLCPCPPRLRASFPVQTDHAKESHLRNSCSSPLLSFSRTCYTKRTVHVETVRFYAPSRTCGKPPFLRKHPPPQCLLFLFFKKRKRTPFLFFLERKGSKRKSSAEQLLFAAVVFFANMLHKTDGSYVNRPFFVPSRTCGRPPFLRKTPSPAMSFVSFLQEKKTYPFQEKKPSPFKRRKPSPLSRSAPRRSAADRPRRNTRS